MHNNFKELIQSTTYLLLFILIVVITAGTGLALTPRSAESLKLQKQSVKGVSTQDTAAISFGKIVGLSSGVSLQSYSNPSSYLTRINITNTRLSDIEQNIVKLSNHSSKAKVFKIIFRSDQTLMAGHTLWVIVNGSYIPINLDNYGYEETVFTIPAKENYLIGLRVTGIYGQQLQNIGIETELVLI